MFSLYRCILSCLFAICFVVNAAAMEIKGRILDASGQPVVGFVGLGFATSFNADSVLIPARPDVFFDTDAEGCFQGSIKDSSEVVLAAFSFDGKQGAVEVFSKEDLDEVVELHLKPLVHVEMPVQYNSEYLQKTSNLSVNIKGGPRVTGFRVKEKLNALLPVGEYDLTFIAIGARIVRLSLEVSQDSEPAYEPVVMEATTLTEHMGKAPPAWDIVAARGYPDDIQLEDFHGKWVLIDIWGYWCGPCVGMMPMLMKFYEERASQRDKFEILAFHNNAVTNFEELDEKLKDIVKNTWDGRELPFPILIDSGKTLKTWEVTLFPTQILIDPQGNVVESGGFKGLWRLQQELDKLRRQGSSKVEGQSNETQ